MALLTTDLGKLQESVEKIEKAISYGEVSVFDDAIGKRLGTNGLYDCYVTFNFVANYITEWADDTTIGAETRGKLIELTNIFKDLMSRTNGLITRLNDFIGDQNELNGKPRYFVNNESPRVIIEPRDPLDYR